jgi:hypothetical protein
LWNGFFRKTKNSEVDMEITPTAYAVGISSTIGVGAIAYSTLGMHSLTPLFTAMILGGCAWIAHQKLGLETSVVFVEKNIFPIFGGLSGALLAFRYNHNFPLIILLASGAIGAVAGSILHKRLLSSWKSCLDQEKQVDPFHWAVTLICARSNEDAAWRNHAQLVIESVGDDEYGMSIAHFCDDGLVHFTPIRSDTLKYALKSQTYIASSEKTQRMVAQIVSETTKKQPFSIRGKSAIFSAGHNCISWALEKLRVINVDLPFCSLDSIAMLPSKHIQATNA